MKHRLCRGAWRTLFLIGIVFSLGVAPSGVRAAPYAAVVMDARSGEILHSRNADSRLHPASLTKMMTLYIAFEAVRLGEISLDTMVTVSRKAAAEPPSKLGLRAGQRIQLRYLIRAAAVKSANDAATAIGEAIEGSEAAFARRMTRTARAMGMTRTTFKNAHGLTESGHLSTANDMTILGRHLFYDYPQYYNIFSRRSTNAGGTEVANTNRRFLNAYKGADGIKTGYTRAAGFNLVASAERGSERIIATVFGGTSTANRNARMAELMDMGFERAPTRVAVNRPSLPRYDNLPDDGPAEIVVAEGAERPTQRAAGKIVRISGAVSRSPRPLPRGGNPTEEPAPELIAAIETDIMAAIASVATEEAITDVAEVAMADAAAEAAAEAVIDAAEAVADIAGSAVADASEATTTPRPRPEAVETATVEQTELAQAADAATPDQTLVAAAIEDAASGAGADEAVSLAADAAPAPAADPEAVTALAAAAPDASPAAAAAIPAAAPEAIAEEPRNVVLTAAVITPPATPDPVLRPEPEASQVVTRLSTSGGRHSGVSLGRFGSRYEAEKALITMSLSDMAGLGGSLRRVVQRNGAFEANFMGMSEEQAALACRRIAARGHDCTTIGG